MAAGTTAGLDWEMLGTDAAPAVDSVHAVLVTGIDPVAAAHAAIGIGRIQSQTRRVAIGDLVGDVEPLQNLVTGDDAHGIVDSFLYGVSLNKIARQVDDAGMLFVMPSGTEPVVTPDILRNERWRRLAAGFREVGALLILVAPSDADGLRELALMLDGVVLVGDATSVLSVPRNSVLAHIDAPASVVPTAVHVPTKSAAAPPPAPVVLPAHVTDEQRPITPYPANDNGMQKKLLIAAGVVIALIAGWFIAGRPGMSGGAGASAPVTREEAAAAAQGAIAAQLPQEAAIPAPPADTTTIARAENPQDSAAAAPYGVVIVATNDEAQALARWADLGLTLPAGTVTMVRIRGERGRFFQMQAGAYTRARQADSLLTALRASGKLAAGAGRVISTPYALMLEAGISRAAAQNVANGYGQRQIAAYPLLQADGKATIFVGAFESPDQAVPLMGELVAKGINPTLYYRTGRSF
ncbi:MAG: hypothetical protein IT355_18190 [Gemmatimonadaceae bacterium]|nr:hypothetical protein [Gemmatimonadaceae bacterium]